MNNSLGESQEMRDVMRLIERVAPTAANVLISGEAGVGKEHAARAIHARSSRAGKDFLVFNCGAIPPGLMEAELFGYEKNSFVGAERAHAGVLEQARGGTLFLDELTEMPLDIQGRLLRAIDMKKFYRVGSVGETQLDVRLIAASVFSPRQAIKAGRLREDMLYRLSFFLLAMPALRDRGSDAEFLGRQMLGQLNHSNSTTRNFSDTSLSTLRQHAWPGNVRELKTCVERAYILADDSLELAPLVATLEPERDGLAERLDIRVGASIDEVERSLIEATLQHFRGNKRRAADTLGCSLKTLYNKLHGYSQASQGFANT